MTQDVAASVDLSAPEDAPSVQPRPRRSYSIPVLALTQLTGSILYERLVNGILG